jgi:glycosyltransferase involved in cell wall biosynthesis
MKVLFVIPSLEPGGSARQLTLLASALPAGTFVCRVCALGQAGPWADELPRSGVQVHVLGWKRLLDPAPLLGLRRILWEFRPDVLHVWGMRALRTLALLGGWRRSRSIVSSPFTLADRSTRSDRLDRWLLRRATRVAVSSTFDQERAQRYGVSPDRIVRVPPGVPSPIRDEQSHAADAAWSPEQSWRCLVGVGPFERHKGFRDALWAFDMLRGPYDDLHFLFIGSGPDLPQLRRYARIIQASDRVHFPGPQEQVTHLLRRAEQVWVPDRVEASVNVALEAMALGRPVIASRLPAMTELVEHGQTGLLVRPGDKAALARAARRLLDDPPTARRLGEEGRQRVAEHFTIEGLVRRWTQVYEELS